MIFATTTDLDTALLPILTRIEKALLCEDKLSLLGRAYGRLIVEAVRGVDDLGKQTSKPRRLPLFYDANRQSIPVVPDETKGGLLFFITTGPAKPVDVNPGWYLSSASQQKQYPLALIMWWNRTKAIQSPDDVRRTIEGELGKCYDWQTTSVEDQLSSRIFAGLDYDFDTHTYMLYPNCGLRIEGLLTVTESICQS